MADAKVLSDALRASAGAGECVMATARAVAAEALARSPSWPRPAASNKIDSMARDLFVAGIVAGFQTRVPMAPLTWASNALHGLAERLAGFSVRSYLWLGEVGGTPLVRLKKGQITDQAARFAGDILLYQARGGEIRDCIRRKVDQALELTGPPVVLLGHSLGGVACVDLLVREALPAVALLVTVGSQAPFLYELNALPSLEYGAPLPGHFVKQWVNIYDPRDFLSYKTEGVFTAKTEAVTAFLDEEVDNGLRFPDAHSGYWANEATWRVVARELSKL